MIERIRGRTLQRIRAQLLRDEPLCLHCKDKGTTALAVEIDHIIPVHKGGSNDRENLQGLCKEHHRVKTTEDMGYRPRVTIGSDGWPVDG